MNKLTLGAAARRIGQSLDPPVTLHPWQLRRLYEKGVLPPAERIGLYRVINEEDLPKITEALRAAAICPPSRRCSMPANNLKVHQSKAETAIGQAVERLAGDHAAIASPIDRLIDRLEFQTILGIGQSTFERRLAMRKLPPPIRLSRAVHRWRLSEVLTWIDQQQANG